MKNKVYIIVEREDGKHVKRRLFTREVCALFDLPYMLCDDDWATFKLNGIDKNLAKVFHKISFIDDCMHGEKIGHYENGKIVMHKKKNNDYLWGKPKWKDMPR